MDRNLRSLVLKRLEKETGAEDGWAVLVLAALEGPASLTACLDGGAAKPARPAGEDDHAAPTAAGPAFLRAIEVEGFRGVGRKARLDLTPGPGLTLIVGRNGCGKSSFADGLELLLTGRAHRWYDRPKEWGDGWRNLHHPDTEVSAEFALEGERGACTIRRTWAKDVADCDDGETWAQIHGRPRGSVGDLGWVTAVESYRPVLSYNELGSMLDEGPSKLYDALAAILGLNAANDAQELLRQERTRREKARKEAENERRGIAEKLAAVDDDRARRAVKALARKDWGLDEVGEILTGGSAEGNAGEVETLRRVAALAAPDPAAVTKAAGALRDASARLEEAAATLVGRADDLASLLQSALEFRAKHGVADCPVCGTEGVLDDAWTERQTAEAERLRRTSREVASLRRAVEGAAGALRAFAPPDRRVLEKAAGLGLDDALAAVDAALKPWNAAAAAKDAREAADGMEAAAPALRDAVAALRAAASEQIARREDVWRPVASELAEWLPRARRALGQGESVPDLKEAENWLKKTAEDMRDERFEPIAAQAIRIWEQLRMQSNVELGAVRLGGSGKRRRVELSVSVDGEECAALGVMSQGELNSLALSLFIPRATLAESPFRFVVIDDPVQSMDPARVDGLARVLEETAKERQVLVFTHDDRLPEAVRRLDIDANVMEVTRREGSVVEVRRAMDPVRRYIEDALALAYMDGLPPDASRRVIPGLCREALEAACMETVRRRRIGRGEAHQAVEKALIGAQTLTKLAALAIFDDGERGGDVMRWINAKERSFGDAFMACNRGAHGVVGAELMQLIRDVEKLAKTVLEIR